MFIRTSYGVSEIFYTGLQERPFQGSDKGNVVAPPIWLNRSMFIVSYLHDSKLASVPQTAVYQVTYQIAAFLHVDDTDLVAINDGKESSRGIVVRIKILIDKW